MRFFGVFHLCILIFHFSEIYGLIVSPCKVQNYVTHPTHGTSLRTKTLVQIVQMPPVFTQTVLVGICENKNQNVTTGKQGEFFSCQQRYSAVEVFIADAYYGESHNQPLSPEHLHSIHFVKEPVITESGCDFHFNFLPFMTAEENPQIPPQHKTFLRSPYHRTHPSKGQQNPQHGSTTPAPNSASGHSPVQMQPVHSQGRSNPDDDPTDVNEYHNNNEE